MHVILSPDPVVNRTVDFVGEATEWLESTLARVIKESGECLISLSGGNAPRPIYERLSQSRRIDWSKVWVTFGDERCVPPDHESSNFRMASEALLSRVSIPPEQVLRMEGETRPGLAAERYEAELSAWAKRRGESLPSHDLMLLGMGEDGHTASLFPGTMALEEIHRLVVANYVPKFDSHRLTVTLPLINESKRVVFLTEGASKAPAYEAVLAGGSDLPAARVCPYRGEIFWFIG